MGVRILHDSEEDTAVLYCSTTDWAFGPLVGALHTCDAHEVADAFLRWLPQDARRYTDAELREQFSAFQASWDPKKDPGCLWYEGEPEEALA